MTIFGWVYVVLTIIGVVVKINEVGKPRKPVTTTDVSIMIVTSALLFLGLFFWGIR